MYVYDDVVPTVPNEWNGKPTKYHFFDGFTQAGTLGKIGYIIGFPVVSILMEGYRYNVQTRNGEEAAHAINQQMYAAQMGPESMNPNAPQDGRFAATVTQQTSQYHQR